MLELEPIDPDTVNWDCIIRQFPDWTVYQTSSWIGFLAETQKARPALALLRDGSNIIGCFTGMVVRKMGLAVLGSPFPGWSTACMGCNLSTAVPRGLLLDALVKFAFRQLNCVHLECMDCHIRPEDLAAHSFRHRLYSGFQIDLTQNEDQLYANLTRRCRCNIRKAQSCGVVVEEAQDSDFGSDYYAQLSDVFAKQGLAPSYGVGRVRALLQHLLPTGNLLLLRAREPEGKCIATGIFLCANHTAYFWGSASWRATQILRPNELLVWTAMQKLKARGSFCFDMGGGGDYKKKYGGQPVAIPWFRRSRWMVFPFLRDTAQALVKLSQVRPFASSESGRD